MPPLDRRTLLLGGLALAVAPAATAEGAPPFRLLDEDPRLGKAVTIRLKRAPVAEVLSAIDGQTGVRLRASAETADEPALVYARERPARDVMRQLALLFNWRWRRMGKSGGYRYELYQDAASKREEEALRSEGRRRIVGALQEEVRLCLELLRHP